MRARPKSLDLVFKTTTTYREVVDTLKNETNLRKHANEILSVFQIGITSYNVTYKDEKTRTVIYNETNGKIEYNGLEARIYLPKKNNWFYVNIRAVPTEVEDDEMNQLMNNLNCGKIIQIERIRHKETGYYNGYRSVAIEDVVVDRIPPFLDIEGTKCKIFLPLTAMKKCAKCL